MPYSEADLLEIEKCPIRLKAYYWRMAQHWKRLANQYRDEYWKGANPDKLKWATTLEAGSILIDDNLDLMVAATIRTNGQSAEEKS